MENCQSCLWHAAVPSAICAGTAKQWQGATCILIWIFSEMWNNESNTVYNIAYYNTTTFCFCGRLHQYNCLIWGTENPRFLWKITAKIFTKSGCLVQATYHSATGPYFYEAAITREMYLDMLQIYSLDELPLSTIRNSYFHQDTTHTVHKTTWTVFWHHWTGHSVPPSWPSRSSELSSCIFHCWEWRKTRCTWLNLNLSMA
jgi:hypothetical protein